MTTTSPRRALSTRADDLQGRLIDFGVAVCRAYRGRHRDPARAEIARQIVRSAMAPAANYAEARHAESRKDFVHKLCVCLKELRETSVWLEMAHRLDDQRPETAIQRLECGELIAIFAVSIRTARANSERQRRN